MGVRHLLRRGVSRLLGVASLRVRAAGDYPAWLERAKPFKNTIDLLLHVVIVWGHADPVTPSCDQNTLALQETHHVFSRCCARRIRRQDLNTLCAPRGGHRPDALARPTRCASAQSGSGCAGRWRPRRPQARAEVRLPPKDADRIRRPVLKALGVFAPPQITGGVSWTFQGQ